MEAIARDKRLTFRQLRVALFLGFNAKFGNATTITYRAVSDWTGMSDAHVGPAVEWLVTKGYVRRIKKKRTYAYQLLMPTTQERALVVRQEKRTRS